MKAHGAWVRERVAAVWEGACGCEGGPVCELRPASVQGRAGTPVVHVELHTVGRCWRLQRRGQAVTQQRLTLVKNLQERKLRQVEQHALRRYGLTRGEMENYSTAGRGRGVDAQQFLVVLETEALLAVPTELGLHCFYKRAEASILSLGVHYLLHVALRIARLIRLEGQLERLRVQASTVKIS